MKQILLVTDGCSNTGINPTIAAAQAKEQGIVINVIGVVGNKEEEQQGVSEIHRIAEAGGGMSRVVEASGLAQTMQMMTRKTAMHTIQQLVGKELRTIMGTSELEQLPPDKRAKVVEVIDDLSETASLKLALLVDTSASMKSKLCAVQSAIGDLQLSLQARSGESLLSVYYFPGKYAQEAEQLADWTDQLANLERLFYKINMRGVTPTGPALLKVVEAFTKLEARASQTSEAWEVKQLSSSAKRCEGQNRDGMLSDYVV